MYDYICINCVRPFQNKNKDRKYCSQECTKSYQKLGVERPCELCGKMTYIPEWKLKTNEKWYFCCREHWDEYQRQSRPTRTCRVCGSSYKRKCNQDSIYCSNLCRYSVTQNPEYLAKMRKKQAGHRINKLERAGYDLLKSIGVDFEEQYIISNFVVDAFIPSYNIVVQFDGDYWHGNTDKFPVLTDWQIRRKELDKKQDAFILSKGWSVIRVWEYDFHSTNGKALLDLVLPLILGG
jgi:very-short-patch-repair endonuclease